MASITLSVPLVDWGKRKNAYYSAKDNVEAAESAELETSRDTEFDARQNLIASLQDYWLTYYRLRRLTLHDY